MTTASKKYHVMSVHYRLHRRHDNLLKACSIFFYMLARLSPIHCILISLVIPNNCSSKCKEEKCSAYKRDLQVTSKNRCTQLVYNFVLNDFSSFRQPPLLNLHSALNHSCPSLYHSTKSTSFR